MGKHFRKEGRSCWKKVELNLEMWQGEDWRNELQVRLANEAEIEAPGVDVPLLRTPPDLMDKFLKVAKMEHEIHQINPYREQAQAMAGKKSIQALPEGQELGTIEKLLSRIHFK
jgi:hypothetical protein